VDPYIEISLHVPEWTSSPFLPQSTKADGVTYSPSSSATANAVSSARTLSVRTAVVKNNGFNPMWHETFSIPFDCVGNMKELIFVEFAVRHQNGDLLGMSCTSLACLERGLFKLSTILTSDR
jgi:phosphatidylinositol phospholipase C delta